MYDIAAWVVEHKQAFFWFGVVIIALSFWGGLINAYEKATRNGLAVNEAHLPKEIYEIIWSGKLDNYQIVLVRNGKGQLLTCCSNKGEELKQFSIFVAAVDGNRQFLMPKEGVPARDSKAPYPPPGFAR